MNRPICSFYYQNIPQQNQQLDQVRSTGTQVSKRSTSTRVTVQRSNQIKPSKIVIPKLAKHPNNPSDKNSESPILQIQQSDVPFQENEKQDKFRLFNWKSLGNFCGVSIKKESMKGCICTPSCKYKDQWSHSCSLSDLTAFRGLKTVRTASEYQIQIEKDIDRTYPRSVTYGSNAYFREMLRQLLIAYSVYDGQVGYVQGMNLIAANLLFHIKSLPQSFWALVELMEYQQLRLIYTGKLQFLGYHTDNINKMIKKELQSIHKQMNRLGVTSRCFLDGWILSLMSKVIPLEQMAPVITEFRKKGWNFLYKVVIQLLRALTNCLLLAEDEPQFLMCLDQQSCKQVGVDWNIVVNKAKQNKN